MQRAVSHYHRRMVESHEIPQAPRLDRIRKVVETAKAGKTTRERTMSGARMAQRDASYYLQGATALGLLQHRGASYALSELGGRLIRTEKSSEDERAVLREAVRTSPVVSAVAGDLLGDPGPTRAAIARAMIRVGGLSARTADQRAGAMFGWRRQLEHARLPYRIDHTDAVEVRDNVEVTLVEPSRPVLRSIHLSDFKSFARADIPLTDLTVFVGANGSGKSNALDAIRFLQGAALELPIADVLRGRVEGGRELWPAIRGGIGEVCRFGNDRFALTSSWQLGTDVVTHCIECAVRPVPMVVGEKLFAEGHGSYLFDTAAGSLGKSGGIQQGRALNVALRRSRGGDKKGGRSPSQTHSSDSSLLGQLTPDIDVHEEVARFTGAVRTAMRSTKFMSISSQAMRDYAPAAATDLGVDGQNISAAVRHLCEDASGKRRLVEWLTELCAPRIVDIDFVVTDLGDVMLQLVEDDGTKISARSLSDGTLRFLGHLVALLSAPRGSILLIEEIENGLHPQRLSLLVQLLEGVTKDRGVQVIATSHSPLVLMALSAERLEHAVVFGRVAGREGTVVRRLGDLRGFRAAVEKRGADRVFESGWLELAL